MDVGFENFDAIFMLFIGVFIVIFIFVIVGGIVQWNKNNNSPRLTVDATVVSKRKKVDQTQHANSGDITGAHGFHTSSNTRYYITFQVDSGDRMELHVGNEEYGMLAEGEKGKLSFQGQRYLDFRRL